MTVVEVIETLARPAVSAMSVARAVATARGWRMVRRVKRRMVRSQRVEAVMGRLGKWWVGWCRVMARMPVPWGMRNHWEVKFRVAMRVPGLGHVRGCFCTVEIPDLARLSLLAVFPRK
jgi:hypothetical protein